MRLLLALVIVAFSVSSLDVVWAEPQPAADNGKDKAEEVVSLMGMLCKWRYPGATLRGAASMSDGGVIGIQSIKCQAVIATPDPVTAVLKFYEEKLAIAKEPEADAPAGDNRRTDGKAIDVQNDSEGRPLQLHVITVNEADSSTTLVISRTEDEEKTHIAWSHFRRLATP